MKITRRFIAFLVVLAAPLLFSSAQTSEKAAAKGEYLAYVGTYTTKTTSKGIYAFRFNTATGQLTAIGVAAETRDPSWLAVYPDGKVLYAVNEAGKNSAVSVFAVNPKSGKLTPVNQMRALGEDPCYIAFDKKGWYVLVANYTSGNVAVFPLQAGGFIDEPSAVVSDSGTTGPNKERQEAAHAHWIETSPDNRFALVADLGLDEVLVYRFDAKNGTLAPGPQQPFVQNALELSPGTGPRHAAISEVRNFRRFLYALGELDSTITVFGTTKEG